MNEMCVFVGGVVDGERREVPLEINDVVVPELGPASYLLGVNMDAEAKIRMSNYRKEVIAVNERSSFVFVEEHISTERAISMLIDGYNPKGERRG